MRGVAAGASAQGGRSPVHTGSIVPHPSPLPQGSPAFRLAGEGEISDGNTGPYRWGTSAVETASLGKDFLSKADVENGAGARAVAHQTSRASHRCHPHLIQGVVAALYCIFWGLKDAKRSATANPSLSRHEAIRACREAWRLKVLYVRD